MKKDILMYFDLITSIKTVTEADALSVELDTLSSSLFKSNVSFNKILVSISETTAQKIRTIFSKNNLDSNNKEVVFNFLQTIKDLIKKFKIIKLVLAFDPPLATVENIHSYVKNAIGIGYILDIEVSTNLLGGAIIIFNGKYNDFSLKKSLEGIFADKKEDVSKMIYD
ncbi:MAG: hypothetical protein HY424_00040 [Candidatus Levybacteria bacterium]|nr:hypothetical protein [Candidatus Levybacteria bacterium]